MTFEEGEIGKKSHAKTIMFATCILVILIAAIFLITTKSQAQTVECKVPSDIKITYDKPVAADQRLDKSFWACNGMVCNRFYTPQEWVTKNCYSQNNQNLCVLKTQQGNQVYPLSALNITAIKECAEYLCLQEVMVRNASYIIPAP